mmetsp:Transcript_58431/g.126919  ORF Transcript_58431/g.126919 Transcript_58431/m.126919 type:complete len:282 (+) Transcript_58431:2524-3369(+)
MPPSRPTSAPTRCLTATRWSGWRRTPPPPTTSPRSGTTTAQDTGSSSSSGCMTSTRGAAQAPTRRSWRAARTTCSTTHSRATSTLVIRTSLFARSTPSSLSEARWALASSSTPTRSIRRCPRVCADARPSSSSTTRRSSAQSSTRSICPSRARAATSDWCSARDATPLMSRLPPGPTPAALTQAPTRRTPRRGRRCPPTASPTSASLGPTPTLTTPPSRPSRCQRCCAACTATRRFASMARSPSPTSSHPPPSPPPPPPQLRRFSLSAPTAPRSGAATHST